MKTLLKLAAGTAASLTLAGAAQAGCGNGMYCTSSHSGSYGSSYGTTGTSTLPPLSSYFSGGSSYSTSGYSTSSYGGTMSASQADMAYGSGSISPSYVGSGVDLYSGASGAYSQPSTVGFYGSSTTLPDLGAGESLQPTSCPVSVYNPEGANVLGCYNVVKKVTRPVANTTYYRVVRPVVYVRYPVPVPVPYTVYSPCGTNVVYSRYGGYGPQGGFGGYRGGCR